MKHTVFFLLTLATFMAYSQNEEDAYGNHHNQKIWDDEPWTQHSYEGEYQVFLDQFFWMHGEEMTKGSVSLGIELVSFPFIPDAFDPNDTINDIVGADRDQSTRIVSDGNFGPLQTNPPIPGQQVYRE